MRFKYLHITPEGSWQSNADPTQEQLKDLHYEQYWADSDNREPEHWIIFNYKGVFGYVTTNIILGLNHEFIHTMVMNAFPDIDLKGKE